MDYTLERQELPRQTWAEAERVIREVSTERPEARSDMAIKIADEKSERKASWAWCSLQPLTGLECHQVSVPVDILLAPLGAKIPPQLGIPSGPLDGLAQHLTRQGLDLSVSDPCHQRSRSTAQERLWPGCQIVSVDLDHAATGRFHTCGYANYAVAFACVRDCCCWPLSDS
jgi:hypothetical protein